MRSWTRHLPWLIVGAVAVAALAFPDQALAAAEHGAEHAAAAAEHGAEAAGHAAEGAGHGEIPHPDWTALGLHLFNLVLLLGVIGYFAGGKIKEAMSSRAAEIKRDIDEANKLRKQARDRFEELEGRLAGFDEQLARMKAEAEAEAVEERDAILARADKEAVRIAEAAERTIQSETAKARMALRRDAVGLAVSLAEQKLQANVGAADDARLSADFFSLVDDAQVTEVPHG